MRLYDLGLLDLDGKLSQYIPDLDQSNKKNLRISEIMTHQSGLKDWIPFYLHTLNEDGICDTNYCYAPSDYFNLMVADALYIQEDYPEVIWDKIIQSKLKRKGKYVYSDLGFYLMQRIVESMNQEDLDSYVADNFYAPLGLTTMTFNPFDFFDLDRIVPTEYDTYFRQQLVHGYVHDPGAAMMGGVAGHAGLFSNANDLAILMQMLLNGGAYGGDQFFKPATIKLMTSQRYKKNRRGIGFDKPETNPDKISPTCESASPLTFGHTGFTGTAVWADPKHDLVYVFLSNRVHPTSDNRKLIANDIRTRIQQVIYDAIAATEPN
jgi:CubicO group peptidase (beta-lactamase class C family)